MQITPQSEVGTHYSSSQNVAKSGKEVSDISATAQSQQIISLAEVRMSELIEGIASGPNVILLAENPLETKVVIQDTPGKPTIALLFESFK